MACSEDSVAAAIVGTLVLAFPLTIEVARGDAGQPCLFGASNQIAHQAIGHLS